MKKKALSGVILFFFMFGIVFWNSMLTAPIKAIIQEPEIITSDIRTSVEEMLTDPGTIPAKRKAAWFGLYHKNWTQDELDQALTSLKDAGIEIIFLLVKVPWGGPDGNVYFNSSYVPMAPPYDWDCLAYVVEKAHEKGMEVHPYLNILEDGYFLYNHPEMAMVAENGENSTSWISPAYQAVRNHQINLMVEVVQKYDVDGIQMDRIRFLGTNYDYNPEMKRLYREKYMKEPSPWDPDWAQFRKDIVSDLVREIYTQVKAVKPQVKFSAAVLPSPEAASMWELQDWPTWVKNGWLDLVVTMAYTTSLSTLQGLVTEEIQAVDCLASLYVGLGVYLLNPSELQDQLNAVNITGVDGVTFFSGTVLLDYPAYLDVIKNFNFGSLQITLGVLNTTILKGENVKVSGSINSHLKGINVTFTYTRPNGSLVERTALTNSCGISVDTYKPDAAGTWNVSASFTIKGVEIESQTISFLVYEHELSVSLEAPDFLEPGNSSLLNATVYNHGLSNEINVKLQIMINGAEVNSTTISELVNRTFYTLSYLWTPTVEAMYNVTAYVQPVEGEIFTTNNVATKIVNVRPIKGYVLFDQTHGTDNITSYGIWVTNLTNRGYVVDTHGSGSITPAVLAGYDIFVIPGASGTYSSSELSAIQEFVYSGGGLLVIGGYSLSLYTNLTGFAGINWVSGVVSEVATDIMFHAVTEGVTSVFVGYSSLKMQVSAPAMDLIRDRAGGIMLTVSELVGRVIGFAGDYSLRDFGIVRENNLRLANNMIDWLMGVRYEHELAVYLEAPRFLMPSNSSLLNATVYNHGLNNETNIELQLMIDGNVVDSEVVPKLVNGSSCTLSYLWIPTVLGTYNVTVYAVPVSGENYTYNNRATRLVVVTYPLVHPMEGQWAKYTMRYFEDGKLIYTAQWNFTYDHYVSPYLINITLQVEYPEWTVVNIMNRRVEDGIWAGMWYFGWIETNITLGSTVNLSFGNATVVGSRIIEAGEYSPDCWELSQSMYTYWYDKQTGLLIVRELTFEYDGHSYSQNITLVATNILVDSGPPKIGIPSRMPDGDVLPGQAVKVSVNVTDALSGVKNVTLSYTINNGTTWENLPMNLNYSNGLYEATIPPQPAGTWVKFKIVAYDNEGNSATIDGTEPYCMYQVIPEFPQSIIPLLLMALTIIFVILARKSLPRKPKKSPRHPALTLLP